MSAYGRAGEINRQVWIQQRTTTQDSYGGLPETWTDIKYVYAKIESLTGNERLSAQAIATDVSHRFTVRYDPIFADPKVVAGYRLLYNERIFDVQWMDNIEEGNRFVLLFATEGMSLG